MNTFAKNIQNRAHHAKLDKTEKQTTSNNTAYTSPVAMPVPDLEDPIVTISTSWYKMDRYRDGLVLVRRGVSRHGDRKG